MVEANDNDDVFKTGAQLLAQWGCYNREQKLVQACMALMSQVDDLHTAYKGQSLKNNIANLNIYCSCADAYRMGEEALKFSA